MGNRGGKCLESKHGRKRREDGRLRREEYPDKPLWGEIKSCFLPDGDY